MKITDICIFIFIFFSSFRALFCHWYIGAGTLLSPRRGVNSIVITLWVTRQNRNIRDSSPIIYVYVREVD